jgi:hypothetical protein
MRTDRAARDECGRTAVRVELHVDGAPLVLTSVSGRIEPLTAATVRFALWTLPAMTAVIVARIHWHALRLWLKKIPFVRKPAPPPAAITSSPQAADATSERRQGAATEPSQTAADTTSAHNFA